MDINDDYNPPLQPNAQSLRNHMTKAEACLWKYGLRAKRMLGYTFKRQRPVLNFIADFYCQQLKLIIEVDGITHTYESVCEKDALRDKILLENGFHILRFTDDEVLYQVNRVLEQIEEKMKMLK